jgi:hypothetical protein
VEKADPNTEVSDRLHVEAELRLTDDGVIAGTVEGPDGEATPFHGWLELMDRIEAIRLSGDRPGV